jgi:sulfite reductase (ferredoxin)
MSAGGAIKAPPRAKPPVTNTKKPTKMYKLPQVLDSEIEDYRQVIPEFKDGKVNPIRFKGIRVSHGIYEQRGDNIFMARIRCASGFVSPDQLAAVGEMAKRHAKLVHVTTRQELQIHNILIDETYDVIKGLKDAGLGTRGSGGNTIRNIMGSIDSGTIEDDVFDITPYVVSLTNKMISEPDSWELPRKVKMAFSSSDSDTGLAAFNDVGFIAKIKDGKRGFKVYFGGGYATKPQVGEVLFDFAPEEDLYAIVDAIKRLFNKHGNRRNKYKARTRFLFYKYGKEKVFQFFAEEFQYSKADPKNIFKLDSIELQARKPQDAPLQVSGKLFSDWKHDNVRAQKQAGLCSVYVPFHHGNVEPEKAIKLGRFAKQFGDDTIRCSYRQNFFLRNIPEEYLGNVYTFLKELEVEVATPYFLNNLVSCTGADTCKLGICLSKGALNAVKDAFVTGNNSDYAALRDVRVNISGCPNSCGQQMVSDLGFFGKAGRNGEVYPAYNIVSGAVIGDGRSKLAEKVAEVSAKDMPKLTKRVLDDYASKKPGYSSFAGYLEAEGNEFIKSLAAEYKNVPSITEKPEYYFDWGSAKQFTVVGQHAPECSAGMFDMIDVDKETIEKTEKELETAQGNVPHLLYTLAHAASRMLLVTRGVDAKTEVEVFEQFTEKFIDAGLVPDKFRQLAASAKDADLSFLVSNKEDVHELGQLVRDLYKNMNDSLQFQIDTENKPAPEPAPQAAAAGEPVRTKDLRGVQCPINFVKTKLELATIQQGQILEIYLDSGAPIENVPRSCQAEGHEITRQICTEDGHWVVHVKKA